MPDSHALRLKSRDLNVVFATRHGVTLPRHAKQHDLIFPAIVCLDLKLRSFAV
jgi:hypothetical protein